MNSKESFTIRPAGRHILTIGRDLIQDQSAAIVELVKNAYDADSPAADVSFKVSENRQSIEIIIDDRGHGMSRDTVINKWLVPSTNDKVKRRSSPRGRTMQGRKGVGRYAASILGDTLLLETVTSEGKKTAVFLEWSKFETADYLDDVEVFVETSDSDEPSGTRLTMMGNHKHIDEWSKRQIQKLQFELKKLIPPIRSTAEADEFSIYLYFDNFLVDQEEKIVEKIEPYPIFDLYDYRIFGQIDANGDGQFTFINQRARNTAAETIPYRDKDKSPTGCGELIIDIRVYDREKESIDRLIRRGLRDERGNYVSNTQARNLLNEYNGVGVYRNGFRIRPLGDPDFDWLKLNEQRIQNPSLRISSNQVIGYVQIQAEELSGLEEKSARDGLRENQAYDRLKTITREVITELEARRFDFRRKTGLSRAALKIERDLEKIFAFDDVKQGIRNKLLSGGVNQKLTSEVVDILSEKEKENNRIAEEIRHAVAIYQGQATLGKIINVILHEGRRPLNFFKNQISNFTFWADQLKQKPTSETLDKVVSITEGMGRNSKVLVDLFGRLDPLAAGKRGPRKQYNLFVPLTDSFRVFENELSYRGISYKIECPKEVMLTGWEQDVYVIMTNLIDNSLYWLPQKEGGKACIEVTVSTDGQHLEYIDYRDTGPGIETSLIESGVIFEPEFTTKPAGTGLGLAIAGEAATRNGLELTAVQSDTGVYFRLQPHEEEA